MSLLIAIALGTVTLIAVAVWAWHSVNHAPFVVECDRCGGMVMTDEAHRIVEVFDDDVEKEASKSGRTFVSGVYCPIHCPGEQYCDSLHADQAIA